MSYKLVKTRSGRKHWPSNNPELSLSTSFETLKFFKATLSHNTRITLIGRSNKIPHIVNIYLNQLIGPLIDGTTNKYKNCHNIYP